MKKVKNKIVRIIGYFWFLENRDITCVSFYSENRHFCRNYTASTYSLSNGLLFTSRDKYSSEYVLIKTHETTSLMLTVKIKYLIYASSSVIL